MMTPSTSHRASRKSSGFNPAVRVRQNEPGERQYSLATNGAPEYTSNREDVETVRPNVPSEVEHLTKDGKIDRRFKGFRDLPEEEVGINPDYQPARTGGTLDDGTHITLEGKPDLRFKENRGLSEDEVNRKWAERLAKEYGIIDGE